jgi:hypothetical protein
MDMVGSRNLAFNFHLARPGIKRGPYGRNGKCRCLRDGLAYRLALAAVVRGFGVAVYF